MVCTRPHSPPFHLSTYTRTHTYGWPDTVPSRPLRWGVTDRTVLDSSIGKPAQGVKVKLLTTTPRTLESDQTHARGEWLGIGYSVTNADGRCLDLVPDDLAEPLQPGTYQIVFETKEYFERTSRKSFYPFVQVGSLRLGYPSLQRSLMPDPLERSRLQSRILPNTTTSPSS